MHPSTNRPTNPESLTTEEFLSLRHHFGLTISRKKAPEALSSRCTVCPMGLLPLHHAQDDLLSTHDFHGTGMFLISPTSRPSRKTNCVLGRYCYSAKGYVIFFLLGGLSFPKSMGSERTIGFSRRATMTLVSALGACCFLRVG